MSFGGSPNHDDFILKINISWRLYGCPFSGRSVCTMLLPKQHVAYCNIKIYTLLPLKIEK